MGDDRDLADELILHTRTLRLAAKAWGPEDGVKVLALHGWLDNAASFDRLAPLLEQARVVALDLPGHGLSEARPPGCAYHFIDSVADVLGAGEALGWERFVLLGHSMGAGIASLVPAAAPDRVSRLVLVEGLGPLSAPAAEVVEGLAASLAMEWKGLAPKGRVFPSLDDAVAARLARSDLDRDSARLLVERGTAGCDGGLHFTHDPRLKLRSRLRLTEEQVLAFLSAIPCPVMAIKATRGWPFPEDATATRLAAIPQLEQVVLDGGHHLHLSDAESVAQVVKAFIGPS